VVIEKFVNRTIQANMTENNSCISLDALQREQQSGRHQFAGFTGAKDGMGDEVFYWHLGLREFTVWQSLYWGSDPLNKNTMKNYQIQGVVGFFDRT
jgi:hypothetical protein